MESKYLKCEFEDGLVYFKIDRLDDPVDEYIYEGLELLMEEEHDTWEKDVYELTEEDLSEMYEDGFIDISRQEFDEAVTKSGLDMNEE